MSIIIGLLLLNILIFLHELGHFFAAKICSIKIEAFSLGMGPVLWHRKCHDTDFRISLLPIGGYCGMKGEKELASDDFVTFDKDSLYGTNAFARAFIGFAGPLVNFFFAIISFTIVAMVGYTYFTASNKVILANEIYPEMHSAAAEAGILTGDHIIMIDGHKIQYFSDISEIVSKHPNETLSIHILRDGESIEKLVRLGKNETTGEGVLGVISNSDELIKLEAERSPLHTALTKSVQQAFSLIKFTFQNLRAIFTNKHFSENIAGTGQISSMLGNTAKTGFSVNFRTGIASVLQFMALISMSLFIMNMLPIPILDGWLVYTSLLEGTFKIKISSKIRKAVQFAGLFILILLFIIAINSDVRYFIGVLNAHN